MPPVYGDDETPLAKSQKRSFVRHIFRKTRCHGVTMHRLGHRLCDPHDVIDVRATETYGLQHGNTWEPSDIAQGPSASCSCCMQHSTLCS